MSHGTLSHLPSTKHHGSHDDSGAQSVMKASFNQPISMFHTLSAIREADPSAIPLSAVMTASLSGPKTGITFIPPMNCNPTIVSPPVTARMATMFSAAARQLPDYFNWADHENVAKSKGWGLRDVEKLGAYTQDPPNQLSCGSCWAVSSASSLSDRIAIQTQGKNPVLSATMALGCVGDVDGAQLSSNGTNGCNGGFPSAAAALFLQSGTVSEACSDYAWCSTSGECSGGGGGGDLNRLIPKCAAQMNSCLKCDNARSSSFGYGGSSCENTAQPHTMSEVKLGAEGTASVSLTDIAHIKADVFLNGPVVVAMAVYQDFFTAPALGYWKKTKGVYINSPAPDAPYSAGGINRPPVSGYHAVVVVGWGVERGVEDWRDPAKRMDVPYWIVRNSWGTGWNPSNKVGDAGFRMPGHWKHAMTQTVDGMEFNGEIGIDRPVSVAGSRQMIGGATSFVPMGKRAPPPSGGGGGSGGKQESWECSGKGSKTKCKRRKDAKGAFLTKEACVAHCTKPKPKPNPKPDPEPGPGPDPAKNKKGGGDGDEEKKEIGSGENADDRFECNDITGACARSEHGVTRGACKVTCSVNPSKVTGIALGAVVGAALLAVVVWVCVKYGAPENRDRNRNRSNASSMYDF
jgi:hypothetical protein